MANPQNTNGTMEVTLEEVACDLNYHLDHLDNTHTMIHHLVDEIEEYHNKGETRFVFELNRRQLATLLYFQSEEIEKLRAVIEGTTQDEQTDQTDTDVWENRSIPTIDIDAMDRARAQEQYGNGDSGQQK